MFFSLSVQLIFTKIFNFLNMTFLYFWRLVADSLLRCINFSHRYINDRISSFSTKL